MEELLYRIVLSMLPLKAQLQNELLEAAGSATELYNYRYHIGDLLPDVSENAVNLFAQMGGKIEDAKREIDFAKRHGIRIITTADKEYPERMRQAADAPTVLYMIGNTDLNTKHTVSIVGTRLCTDYGRDLCHQFIDDLKTLVPDVVVFSGLAYGIDVAAHRRCLERDIPTIGVLAHGLDTIYPASHRYEANRMCTNQGGLLTEYPSGTKINKVNFIARNRIIAGCTDATIIVESSEKGGSLHTAHMAQDYNKDVYTFPARITDKQSFGCLDLVYNNVATLIRSAEQFVERQGWKDITPKQTVEQTELFPQFDEETTLIMEKMRLSDEPFSTEQLAQAINLPLPQMKSKLIDMEMKGVVNLCPGGRYRLTNSFR